jgi:hypothetical protein
MKRYITFSLVAGAAIAIGFIGFRSLLASNSDDKVGPLLWPGRSHLSICVDDAAPAGEPDQVDESVLTDVSTALDSAMKALSDIPPEYAEREVSMGCPPASAEWGTPQSKWDVSGRHVESPSEHEVFVYIADPTLYEETFGSEPFVITTEEFHCQGSGCVGVTIGAYVPNVAEDRLLREALSGALLLLRPPAAPEPTLDWAACERGEQPGPGVGCERYEDWLQEQGQEPEG